MTIRHKWCIAMNLELELKLKFSFICVKKNIIHAYSFYYMHTKTIFYFILAVSNVNSINISILKYTIKPLIEYRFFQGNIIVLYL